MQKRSPKIESIQEKKRSMHKESVAAEEEMRRVREEMNKREERFHQRSKKVGTSSEACRQERKEEASTPPKSMNAALIRWRSSFSLWERRMRSICSKFCSKKSFEDLRPLLTCANAMKRRRKRGE